jgi:hypothetical protein
VSIKAITPLEHPVARTNMLKVECKPEEVIEGLMTDSGNGTQVQYQILPYQRQKGESWEDFYRRVDVGIKQFITTKLGATALVQNYERIAITKDSVLFLHLGAGASNVDGLIAWHRDKGITLHKAVALVLKLKLKLSYLASAARHYDLTLTDANSDLFIGAMEIVDNKSHSIVDALKCDVFYSADDEICLSVSSVVYKFDKASTTVLSTAVGSVVMNKSSKQLFNGSKVSATVYSDRPFMAFRLNDKQKATKTAHLKGYGNSKNYHLTICQNKIIEILQNVGIDYHPIVFQANKVGEDFISTEINPENELVIIDCFDRYPNDEIKQQYRQYLIESLCAVKVIDGESAPSAMDLKTTGVSYVVINPSSKSNGSSIVNQATGYGLNTFWQALAISLKGKKPAAFDYYTNLKITRFVEELGIVCQGIDVENVAEEKDGKIKLIEINKNVIKKAKAELWIKESIFQKRQLSVSNSEMAPGEYQVFYTRRTDDGIHFCSVTDIKISSDSLTILGTKRWDKDSAFLFDRQYPFLKSVAGKRIPGKTTFETLKDQSFVLHEKETGSSLIAYESIRVPKIIGNAVFDNTVRHDGEGIGRYRSGDDNPLPYYLTQKIRGQMHRVFIEDNGSDGLRYFVASAQAINETIEKQNKIYAVLAFDRNGEPMNAGNQGITHTFLNSFTYNLLRNNESAKKSLLQKVAEISMEN